jgi:hypothetical protein
VRNVLNRLLDSLSLTRSAIHKCNPSSDRLLRSRHGRLSSRSTSRLTTIFSSHFVILLKASDYTRRFSDYGHS